MNTITALFKLPAGQLDYIRNVCEAQVELIALSDKLTEVVGPAQQVMFLIGGVAAQGEDSLVSAYFTEAAQAAQA